MSALRDTEFRGKVNISPKEVLKQVVPKTKNFTNKRANRTLH